MSGKKDQHKKAVYKLMDKNRAERIAREKSESDARHERIQETPSHQASRNLLILSLATLIGIVIVCWIILRVFTLGQRTYLANIHPWVSVERVMISGNLYSITLQGEYRAYVRRWLSDDMKRLTVKSIEVYQQNPDTYPSSCGFIYSGESFDVPYLDKVTLPNNGNLVTPCRANYLKITTNFGTRKFEFERGERVVDN